MVGCVSTNEVDISAEKDGADVVCDLAGVEVGKCR